MMSARRLFGGRLIHRPRTTTGDAAVGTVAVGTVAND